MATFISIFIIPVPSPSADSKGTVYLSEDEASGRQAAEQDGFLGDLAENVGPQAVGQLRIVDESRTDGTLNGRLAVFHLDANRAAAALVEVRAFRIVRPVEGIAAAHLSPIRIIKEEARSAAEPVLHRLELPPIGEVLPATLLRPHLSEACCFGHLESLSCSLDT